MKKPIAVLTAATVAAGMSACTGSNDGSSAANGVSSSMTVNADGSSIQDESGVLVVSAPDSYAPERIAKYCYNAALSVIMDLDAGEGSDGIPSGLREFKASDSADDPVGQAVVKALGEVNGSGKVCYNITEDKMIDFLQYQNSDGTVGQYPEPVSAGDISFGTKAE
ncbi:MAG: hypothetical protein IKP47_03710 [Ruminococcus sp.]|nr:hypothetical protein [Ruminococcus sp.]